MIYYIIISCFFLLLCIADNYLCFYVCMLAFDRFWCILDWSYVVFCCLRVKPEVIPSWLFIPAAVWARPTHIRIHAHMHAAVKCTHTNTQTHTHTITHTLPPALSSQFGSLKIKMTIRSHNFWMRLLKRRWAAEDFTSGPRSVQSESQRFNMHRRASNSWSVQSVKYTHTHTQT